MVAKCHIVVVLCRLLSSLSANCPKLLQKCCTWLVMYIGNVGSHQCVCHSVLMVGRYVCCVLQSSWSHYTLYFENENEDDFQGQEYDTIGPVDKMTEWYHLSSLAVLGVQTTEEHSMHITHLQPLQGDQLTHHPLSNQSLSRATSTTPSSATQNLQPADQSTSVVTGTRSRPKHTIR